MNSIKRYRIVILGALAVILIVIISRSPKEPGPKMYSFTPPAGTRGAVPAALAPNEARKPAGLQPAPSPSKPGLEGQSELLGSRAQDTGSEAEPEPGADSTSVEDSGPDLEAAKAQAVAEVRQFNENLASTLWTFNPNARKTRLKAAELVGRAGDIEGWVQTQDKRTDWSPEERQEWGAQRDIWLAHARELKQVANRLSATRGTRRKVRMLAQEMKDNLKSANDD